MTASRRQFGHSEYYCTIWSAVGFLLRMIKQLFAVVSNGKLASVQVTQAAYFSLLYCLACMDLVGKCLSRDGFLRPGLEQILEHAWIKADPIDNASIFSANEILKKKIEAKIQTQAFGFAKKRG